MTRSFHLSLMLVLCGFSATWADEPLAGLDADYRKIFVECDRNKDKTIAEGELTSFKTRLKAPLVRGRDMDKLGGILIMLKDKPDGPPIKLLDAVRGLQAEILPDANEDDRITHEEFTTYVKTIVERREALIQQARLEPVVPDNPVEVVRVAVPVQNVRAVDNHDDDAERELRRRLDRERQEDREEQRERERRADQAQRENAREDAERRENDRREAERKAKEREEKERRAKQTERKEKDLKERDRWEKEQKEKEREKERKDKERSEKDRKDRIRKTK